MWRSLFIVLLIAMGLWRLAYDSLLISIEQDRVEEERTFYEERWCWTHPRDFGCREPESDGKAARPRDPTPDSHETTVRTTLPIYAPPLH